MKGIFTSLSIREKGNTIWCFYTTKDNCRVYENVSKVSPAGVGSVLSVSPPLFWWMGWYIAGVEAVTWLFWHSKDKGARYWMHFYVLDNQTLWNQLPIIVRLESLQRQMLRFSNSEDFINRYITQCSTI